MSKFAFIFPGQGSQSVGMLAELSQSYPAIRDTFAEASAILGYDLWQLCVTNRDNLLDKTEYAQPILLTASIAIWRLWQSSQGATPHFLAGHSLGEYSALVVSQALTFADALKAVSLRGKYMQLSVPEGEGAMAAIIGLSDADVGTVCQQAVEALQEKFWVSPANFNAPSQVVISGHKAAVQFAMDLARTRGAKLVKMLTVSVPSHCRLMQHAAHRMQAFLETIPMKSPQYPIVNNVAAEIQTKPAAIREALVSQLCAPVLWTAVIEKIIQSGATIFLECGANSVLAGLNKRIDKRIQTYSLESPETFKLALDQCKESL